MNAIVKVPVSRFVKSYIFEKYKDHILDEKYLDLRRSRNGLFRLIKEYIDESGKDFEIPDPSIFTEEKLEILLPQAFIKKGLSSFHSKKVGKLLNSVVKYEMINFVSILASLPFFSKTAAIRIFYNQYYLTDEHYDFSHFRRYFDRYCFTVSGEEFKSISKRFNSFLIEYINERSKK